MDVISSMNVTTKKFFYAIDYSKSAKHFEIPLTDHCLL